jgi:hypothetical protein
MGVDESLCVGKHVGFWGEATGIEIEVATSEEVRIGNKPQRI